MSAGLHRGKVDDESLAGPPELSDVIEKIGLGPAQICISLICGGVFACEGAGLLTFINMLESLPREWNLDPWVKSTLQSTVFCGILIGSLVSGPLASNFGRVLALQICFAGSGLACLVASTAAGFWCILACGFVFGLAVGIGIPSCVAFITEISPVYWRNTMNCIGFTLFSVGEVFSCLVSELDDPTLKTLHWRSMLQLIALPPFLFLFLSRYLRESPSWLAITGRYDEAQQSLDYMRAMNGREGEAERFRREEGKKAGVTQSAWEKQVHQWNILFSSKLCFTTAVIMVLCIVFNLSYFGSMYAFPQILETHPASGQSVAMELLTSALWEIPSNLLVLLLCNVLPRKSCMQIVMTLGALSMTLFVLGAWDPHWQSTTVGSTCCRIAFFGCRCFTNAIASILYQYAAEVFPTEVRSTGLAVCLATGRVAAILAPLAFEFAVYIHFPLGFLLFLALLLVVGSVLAGLLPFETFGAKLQTREVGALNFAEAAEADRSYGTAKGQ